jgi:hypothetical protein
MGLWDSQSIGMMLVGASITCSGLLIGLWLLGVRSSFGPILLLVLVVLVVIGAAMLVISDYQSTRSGQP